MKILHIVPTYLPAYRYGGPIQSVHELNAWLVRSGAEVTVYTTTTGIDESWFTAPDAPELQPGGRSSFGGATFPNFSTDSNAFGRSDLAKLIDGVKIYYFPTLFPRSWYYSCALRSALQSNTEHFDIVHVTSVFLSASFWGAKYAKKFNKPYIISPRGSLIPELIEKKSSLKKRIYLNLIERRNLAGATAIHFTTELEKEEYIKLELPLKRAIVITNGMEISNELRTNYEHMNKFEPRPGGRSSFGGAASPNWPKELDLAHLAFRKKFNISENAKIVLSLGRLNWKKGFDTLIPAFAEAVKQEPNTVLIITGGDEDNYQKEIGKMIQSNIQKLNIIFTGDLRGEDKAAALQSADIFAMPSYSENFGNSAVEAMAYGVPVIVTTGVGIAPDIKEAKAGIVIEKNEEQLTKAIIGLLRDENLRKALGERGKKLLEEKYSWQNVAKRWMRVYHEIIKQQDR